MNKDQVEGRVDQSIGKVKEAAGKLVGNEKQIGRASCRERVLMPV